MAKSGDYTFENSYEPGVDSFKPGDNVSHYLGKNNLISAGQMGMTTDPRMANQLSALSHSLNVGTKNIEIGTMNMQTFDSIPKQHFAEMRRKSKLAGSEVSLHAPIQDMDPSGFGERGWESSKQQLVERQLKDVVDKAASIDKDGNIPITIHGSNTAGSTFKYVDGEKKYEQLVGVDRITGQLVPIKEETRYRPGGEKGEVREKTYDPLMQLENSNHTQWENTIDEIEIQRENAERVMQGIPNSILGKYNEMAAGQEIDPMNQEELTELKRVYSAAAHIKEAEMKAMAAFDKAYKLAKEDGNEAQLKGLNEISKQYSKDLQYSEDGKPSILSLNPRAQSDALFKLSNGLRNFQPNMIESVEDFSKDKASETFANVALHSYKKYGKGAPVVSIENLYQGMGFSQGEDLNELVEKSQEKFVERAIKDGTSKAQAEEMAKKLIGVTFDVGHLNMSRAHGFNEENLAKEAEAIKKHVKHVHITDNFGYGDSHLPIGMGNVPVQALLEALGDEGERARKINEVGGWFEHFKTNPFPELLGGAGSQIYSSGDGPNWAQTSGFQQSYIEGYGQMLPDTHYQTFGAGFSQLPQSLGGQRGQNGGRMGGGF